MLLFVIPLLLCIWLAVVTIVAAACQVSARADREAEAERALHAGASPRRVRQRASRQLWREQRPHARLRRDVRARRARV